MIITLSSIESLKLNIFLKGRFLKPQHPRVLNAWQRVY